MSEVARTISDRPSTVKAEYASFMRRLGAFTIDIIPITIIVTILFYLFFGFDRTFHHYLQAGPRNQEARSAFIEERNGIRTIAGVVFVFYAAAMHASPWRATVGKRLLNIQVVNVNMQRIGLGKSFKRSCAMMLSVIPAFIGCLAMLWSKTNQTWHDRLSDTLVIHVTTRVRDVE